MSEPQGQVVRQNFNVKEKDNRKAIGQSDTHSQVLGVCVKCKKILAEYSAQGFLAL